MLIDLRYGIRAKSREEIWRTRGPREEKAGKGAAGGEVKRVNWAQKRKRKGIDKSTIEMRAAICS